MVIKLHVDWKNLNVNRLRSISSQFIASLSSLLLVLNLGMALNFSTVIMPALLNTNEELSLDETQASWFGGLSFLTQPVGALLSAPIVDYFGRRKASFMTNIPMIAAWLIMYFARNLPTLFLGSALLGICSGIMEAPINSYLGEISEPSVRGPLCTLTLVFMSLGILFMYFLGTVVSWRNAALISLVAPAVSMFMVIFSPETPVWLLAKHREKEALRSLCQVRGWTTPENVKEEFNDLIAYTENMKNCVICWNTDRESKNCEHESMNWFVRRILIFRHVMLCKETMRPLSLVIMYFLFYIMSGFTPIRPNLINICSALGTTEDGQRTALMIAFITLIASIFIIGLIKIFGKRKLAIFSIFGCGLTCLLMSVYAKKNLDDSVFSYNPSTFPTETSVIPVILLYLLTIFTGLSLPWLLLGEMFPFRSRAYCQGLSAASNYLFSFIGSKTAIDLESNVMLWGMFATYSGFGFVGTVFLYFFLPETEGKSLQEIEEFYNGELRIFADDPISNRIKRLNR